MESVPARPTNLAALPRLLSYAQSLTLEPYLVRAKRAMPTLALALVWLAWRGTGRPHRLGLLDEPLLPALLGRSRILTAQTLHRSLGYFAAKAVRQAVERAYLAELPTGVGASGPPSTRIRCHTGAVANSTGSRRAGRARTVGGCGATGSIWRLTPTPAR